MLIIFDCDGVLIDSEILAAGVHADLLTEMGLAITQEEVITRFTGLTHEQISTLLAQQLGRPLPEDYRQRTLVELDRRMEGVKPIAGVHAMLDQLTGPRCVCSNSSSARLQLSLTATGLWERLAPHIFSAPEVGRSKPAPDVYLHAAKAFGVSPAKTLVVEDSAHGVSGAVAAGMRVIGFTGGGHTWPGHAETLKQAGALQVHARLPDVAQALQALQA
ncbi:HAD family hydrolase [Stigmatella erecta]|uniref:Haloacid dehalogenase superfamily, subfamily IA, variant 3 with third motif having DD or ED n=1 Tax=Stigmatella erecta TaxID=83460 RepID=A0A1I0KFE5_9BACT|nr:HAD family hydrolase [Stigmatella erecta]SEU22966.1 haloacid dehalogenase superfamily, subfamily IA, variant 3 with third motif having DD or ED [Stigmatella erecta]